MGRLPDRSNTATAGPHCWPLLGCGRAPDPLPPLRAALDEAFKTEVIITLGEDPQDSIATPEIFKERVAVLGSGPRLTYLTANLAPDTIVQLPGIMAYSLRYR